MSDLEESFGGYSGANKVNIMVLQPPANFETIMGEATFATGENMLGGVAVYTPKSPEYIRKYFGHASYPRHIYDGLAHELTHFYSTTAWQGRYKSLLFPSSACPEPHKQLIGEMLTADFHNGISHDQVSGKNSFIASKILAQLSAWKAAPRKKPFLDLFLLDLWLRSKKGSLKAATVHLINEYGHQHKPYRTGAALATAAEACCGKPLPPWLRTTLLTPHIPDYDAKLKAFPNWDRKDFNPLHV